MQQDLEFFPGRIKSITAPLVAACVQLNMCTLNE